MRDFALLLSLFTTSIMASSTAHAFFGSDVGPNLVWYILGFSVSLGIAVLLLAYYPARILYKRRKAKKAAENAMPVESVSAQEADNPQSND